MKKFPGIIILLIVVFIMSCKDDEEDTWTQYQKWRNENAAYFNQKRAETDENGFPVYTEIYPVWDPGSFILMKTYKKGDGTKPAPLNNSTVKFMYKGMLYNGTAFDSTYLYTDSATTGRVDQFIQGFQIALTSMQPGDSCQVIIPQNLGYGAEMSSSVILPHSTLIFDLKLIDVLGYEHQVP